MDGPRVSVPKLVTPRFYGRYMVADTASYAPPRLRLTQHFATRATTNDPATWLAQAWTRAVLAAPPGSDDAAVLALLREAWETYRADHPGEPAVAFRVPGAIPEEAVVPGPPPYAEFAPLRFGRYGVEPPVEDRF